MREKDMRMSFDDEGAKVQNDGGDNVDRSRGAARAISVCSIPPCSYDVRLMRGH